MAPTSRSNMIRTRLALIRRVVVLGGMQKGGGNYALKDWAGKTLPALEPPPRNGRCSITWSARRTLASVEAASKIQGRAAERSGAQPGTASDSCRLRGALPGTLVGEV